MDASACLGGLGSGRLPAMDRIEVKGDDGRAEDGRDAVAEGIERASMPTVLNVIGAVGCWG